MTDQRWLSPAELSAWKKFIAVVELLPGVLDSQLQRDADLTHFEYFSLAMLSEAPDETLRMTALASLTNSTLPRLSHVVSRLEQRGYILRSPCAEDRRATNASLTAAGRKKVMHTAPGHVGTVLANVISPLSADDVNDLDRIMGTLLEKLDPENRFQARGA
ncbi:MarR family winged helix-turn-helix transcriptional regulator [Subtercola boreus]|uniref:MarR family transcriptional regulator n=1 Tax=Subtercola boreus TaxID=120213 RepID=A0A3E0WF27_9MICO|nr:MarR family transcriptional regulator [Subtercola boreus]RFA23375.1 MarR family transcriptional regulator [Subtercola boreus]RFA23768.1 MarR family transcriptional regulator [Subtercola boreus]RFA29469.1 MarR family transcriptional regulator [Subtercola boreus]